MAELDTEHVRMLNTGRQRVAYTSPLNTDCFSTVKSKKTQLLQHGNTYGLTFVASKNGFVMTTNIELEESCTDYTKRRQEAIDHRQKLTLEEIHELPVSKEVVLPSIAYWIALSTDELMLAVAYGDSVALYEVAHIVEAITVKPYHTFTSMQAQEIAWCSDPTREQLMVLTCDKKVVLCTLDGAQEAIKTDTDASSIAWSPSGQQIAVGLVNGTVAIYTLESIKFLRLIQVPECCTELDFEVHHINWAEDNLILAGYHQYEDKNDKTIALACIYDRDECIELDEIVGFFDVDGRRHQYFSLFLSEWRMFFIGCSLSADIELLVSDPETSEWQIWKPLEKYQARLPDNSADEESFPMGLALNLNSTVSVSVDGDPYPPVPIIACTNTEGLLLHFAFVDTTVSEVDFVKRALPFDKKSTRTLLTASAEVKKEKSVSSKTLMANEYGQNDENEFADYDGDSSDTDEERKEEEDNARTKFRTIALDGANFILSEQFPNLFKVMGSTYDEEVHAATLDDLRKDGKIYEDDFVSWYVNWIFGDEDYESDEDKSICEPLKTETTKMKSKEEIEAAFSKFTVAEGSWKCAVCMVSNGPDENKCSACETPNPAAPKIVAPAKSVSVTSAGSIGSGGFSFPVSIEKDSKSLSFSFGGPEAKSTEFSFGNMPTTTACSGQNSSTSSGTGFTFSTMTSFPGATDTSAFNFGVKADDAQNTVNDTESSSVKKTTAHEYGQNDENEFASSDGESSDEEEQRKEEEATARALFRTLTSDGADFIASTLFPKLFAVLGSTYDEEEHASTVESLSRDGKIYEDDFVSWYVNWLFGAEDSESEEPSIPPKAEPVKMKSKEEIAAVFSKYTATEGSWKCAVCMVNNAPHLLKCSACETPNPASSKEIAPATTAIGSEGFSFPVDQNSKSTSISFGANSSAGIETAGEAKPNAGSAFNFSSDTTVFTSSSLDPKFAKESSPNGTTEAKVLAESTESGSNYPPDTTTRPKPPLFHTPSGYPPDTTSKPKPPVFSAVGGSQYPPDTTSKSKLSAVGATGGSGYPPDTTSKPKPPAFSAASSSGYPPDTTSKPKPPAFSAASSSGYPPDTTSKPKPPAFSAASSSSYPPDTTSKPKPPAFSAAGGADKPPEAAIKAKPVVTGALSGSSYPPDTTSKPKPPPFGAFGTSQNSMPKPAAASCGGYPPDTTSKPKPPAFGTASNGGYPPDTTGKPKPPAFGQPLTSDPTALTPSFPSNFSGKSIFGSNPNSSTQIGSTALKSPFGVVPKSNEMFSFGSTRPSDPVSTGATSSTRPSFSFDTFSSKLEATQRWDKSEDQLQTKRTLNFGDTSAFEASANKIPISKTKAMPLDNVTQSSKDLPSSRMEGQLWKLIVDFDKSLKRVNKSATSILSEDVEFSKKVSSQIDKLVKQISSLCDELNVLDDARDRIEKDVLFVIGSDGDVHEQLEYGREILDSFNDESLKKTLDEQPLDARSKEVYDSLKKKLSEVGKCCVELESDLSTLKSNADRNGVVSSAQLFRVLKRTYDKSKAQYNKACELAEFLDKLSLRSDRMFQMSGSRVFQRSQAEARTLVTKAGMTEMIAESEERSQEVRRHFLNLCNNVITPRDVFSTPLRKLASPAPSTSVPPLRSKACSKLMPKTQLSVASPVSTATSSTRSISFKEALPKTGSKLAALAEALAPKDEPVKLVETPQTSVGVGKAPQRPSLGALTTEDKLALSSPSKPNALSFSKDSSKNTFGAPMVNYNEVSEATSETSLFEFKSPAVKHKRKANENSTVAFSLGGNGAQASSSSFSFGGSTVQSPSVGAGTINYKSRLEDFYKVHNPAKLGNALEKTLTTYKGREEELFTRLFTVYVPTSKPEDVQTYLKGGPVPPKCVSVEEASQTPAPASFGAKSPGSGFGVSASASTTSSPFGTSPSAFSLGPAASTSFGSVTSSATNSFPTSTSSPFSKPAVDYRQKLVEFYQKHNPDKLSSVDATLQKYKGNEDKLFQNLALKYKVKDVGGEFNVPPASPAVQPVTSGAITSPFGNIGAFSTPSTSAGMSFGSASSLGFGAAKPAPSASPFGTAQAPASSPFGGTTQSSTGFGSAPGSGFSAFQPTTATTSAFSAPSPFGTASSTFGAAGGTNYRDRLTAFYQQYNPSKLSAVDTTLAKYKGREDQLFQMLEQKYVKKTPVGSTSGGFGIPSTTAFGTTSSFGTPSTLGSASSTPAFGSASALGGTQSGFGGNGSGFGIATRVGGGFGSAAPVASTGTLAGSGFGAFGSQPPSFGSAAQQPSGFGATNSGGFGFGSGAATSGFSQPAAFNSSSFTQMR
ncbi:putative Zinc finger, RanBP2-type, EF-hand domain pair, Zinc finger, RanBP2-type superfamily [Plasmopara halstedii]